MIRGSELSGAAELIWVGPAAEQPSGGTLYNRRVLEALDGLGVAVVRLDVPGSWPSPSAEQAAALRDQLASARAQHHQAVVIVDGLLGAAVPDLFAGGVSGGDQGAESGEEPLADVLLWHLPVALDGADERLIQAEGQAVRAASAVVVTSRWAAAQVRTAHGRDGAEVIIPGVDPAAAAGGPVAPSSAADPVPGFAVVASLTPRKNHRVLIPALAALLEHPWQLHLAGPGAETVFGRELLDELAQELPGRIIAHGSLEQSELEELWAATDLLLLPSRAETYGMVVTEAAARGIPSIVSAGTGAVEALDGAGLVVPADSPRHWYSALHRWLSDPGERDTLRTAVDERRGRLTTWQQSAHRWMRLVRSLRTG